MDSFGISDDQLLRNVAKRLHSKLKGENNMQWPPHVSELEQDGRSESLILLIKLITWAKNPSNNDFDNDSSALALSDLVFSFITGNRIFLKTQLAITIHGLTRNKELLQLLHKFGITTSYNDAIDLESAWAYEENKVSQVCPPQLLNGFPGTAIIDNDDFREDTLAGGVTSHRTNMMFVQSEKLESEHFHGKTEYSNKRAKEGYDVTPNYYRTLYYKKKRKSTTLPRL